jgi:hypothetical protein
MKAIVLFTIILLATSAKSQSLLDAIYSGKLKADTGAVLRKGDSLKIKENMAQKVVADSIRKDSIAAANVAAAIEKQNAAASTKETTNGATTNTSTAGNPGAPPAESSAVEKAVPKDNNRIWKTFVDSVSNSIKSEVLSSGKIKKGAYSVLINYEIMPTGQINIISVASDPENSFLDGQIKMRLTLDAPALNPVLGTNGQPRTVARKQMLTFVK